MRGTVVSLPKREDVQFRLTSSSSSNSIRSRRVERESYDESFPEAKRLICDLETLSPTYGHFYAQPFERGFGTTIGNALRRVLLSSIEGRQSRP